MKTEKPPAALAGGGLGNAELTKTTNQARLPARRLWLLIRIAGSEGISRIESTPCQLEG
jgi:hypothetical protein